MTSARPSTSEDWHDPPGDGSVPEESLKEDIDNEERRMHMSYTDVDADKEVEDTADILSLSEKAVPVSTVDDDCLRAWSVIPCLTSITAWILSLILLLDCKFLFLDLRGTVGNSNSTTSNLLKFGLFAYEEFNVIFENSTDTRNTIEITRLGNCVGYPADFDIGQHVRTARACATVAVILGAWMTLLLWLLFCCRFFCLMCPDFLVIVIYLLILPLMQGLTMMLSQDVCNFSLTSPPLSIPFSSESAVAPACGISKEGLTYPFSIALWIITGLLYAFLRPRHKDDFEYFR